MKFSSMLATFAAGLLSVALTVTAAPAPGAYGTSLYRRDLHSHLQSAPVHSHHVNKDHTGRDVTFAGHMPAHTTGQMTPAQLHQYAQHIHGEIHRQHPGIQHDMIVAATHRTGDNHVAFHTAPRGESFNHHQNKNFNNMHNAMTNHGLTAQNGGPWHHAETAAVRQSMRNRGATNANAHEAIQHHTVGVYGHLTDEHGVRNEVHGPCSKCRGALTQMGVQHRR